MTEEWEMTKEQALEALNARFSESESTEESEKENINKDLSSQDDSNNPHPCDTVQSPCSHWEHTYECNQVSNEIPEQWVLQKGSSDIGTYEINKIDISDTDYIPSTEYKARNRDNNLTVSYNELKGQIRANGYVEEVKATVTLSVFYNTYGYYEFTAEEYRQLIYPTDPYCCDDPINNPLDKLDDVYETFRYLIEKDPSKTKVFKDEATKYNFKIVGLINKYTNAIPKNGCFVIKKDVYYEGFYNDQDATKDAAYKEALEKCRAQAANA